MKTAITLRHMPSGMHGSRQQLVAGFAQTQRISLTTLAREISAQCTLTPADILGCIEALTAAVVRHVSRGHSVSLGSLGTVSATLKVETEPAKPQATANKPQAAANKPTTAHAQPPSQAVRVKTLRLGRIAFRPSPLLRQRTEEALQELVVRPQRLVPRTAPHTTPEQRLRLLQAYLRRYSTISVRQYAELASISRYRASLDLHRWQHEPDNHIGVAGCGTHRMTVWEDRDLPNGS